MGYDADEIMEEGRSRRCNGGGVKRAAGGPLTAEHRNDLPEAEFALPGRRYPINDANHARNALARVSQHGSTHEKAEVRAKVHAKYPSIGEDD